MSYFKLNGVDFSNCVSSFEISKSHKYNSQTNAAGDTVVDYINSKRSFTVGIIPLDDVAASNLLQAVSSFNVSISFLNPYSNMIEENLSCIIPEENVSYYTIQADKVMLNAFTLKIIEL